MEFVTYLENYLQLNEIKKTSIKEVILEHKFLSRTGENSTNLLISLAKEAVSLNISPILQWDLLSTEIGFQNSIKLLNRLPLKIFKAVRVQDLGAAQWMKQEHPNIPIHLILETGNHNLTGIIRLSEYFGKQLNRLVLSTEIPKSKLIEYCKTLSTDCELLCVGRILLFYSPRKLFRKNKFYNKSNNQLEHKIFSDEKPKKIFPTIENHNGTFMYLDRDLFLFDYLPELKDSELSFLRLDLRHIDSSHNWIKEFKDIIKNYDKSKVNKIKSAWPVAITNGFFRANRTDLAIERIKNPYLKKNGKGLVGYVLESVKQEHIILFAQKTFKCGESLIAITPEGRKCIIFTKNIKTSNGVKVNEVIPDNIYQIPHVKFVTANSLIYKSSKS